jgi:hypothetical protein
MRFVTGFGALQSRENPVGPVPSDGEQQARSQKEFDKIGISIIIEIWQVTQRTILSLLPAREPDPGDDN